MERCSGGSTEMTESTPSTRAALHSAVVPSSPPPSYEHVLEETRLEAARAESERCAPAPSSPVSPRPSPDEEGRTDEKAPPIEEATTAATPPMAVAKRQKIMHKSSKELYRAVAAQWGITCKMSDHCRCLDCQSNYFDCEYDQNEQEKTDGGLGAGTPMFISEVMQGTACSIL